MDQTPTTPTLDDLRREVSRIAEGGGAFQDFTKGPDFRAFVPSPPDPRLRPTGRTASPAERGAFGRWLVMQAGRGGLVGELAKCAMADHGFPKDGDPEAVRQRLRVGQAEGDMFEAVDEAELDWLSY
jgi:hypothetical protein